LTIGRDMAADDQGTFHSDDLGTFLGDVDTFPRTGFGVSSRRPPRIDLGPPHTYPRDLRHWRATQMLREGVPVKQVRSFLNHRSIRTTQLYQTNCIPRVCCLRPKQQLASYRGDLLSL